MINRVENIDMANRTWPLCLTVSAQDAISEKCGGIENIGDMLDSADVTALTKNICWLLAVLMRGGYDHARTLAKFADEECSAKEPPAYEDLQCILCSADTMALSNKIISCISVSSSTEVALEPEEKNVKTTPESN